MEAQPRKGRLHSAARAVGIMATTATFTGLFFMFGTANQHVDDSLRRAVLGSILAGLAFSLVGLALLVVLAARKTKAGWGLLVLVILPLLVCGLLLLAAVSSR